VGNSPPLFVLGGHPHAPRHGAPPPGPPFSPPSLALGLPAAWVPLVAGLLRWATPPLFVLGGHPPCPPPWGSAPWTPIFPTPVGFGFASGLGPTRGGVAKVGNSLPLLVFGGHIPQTPCQGGFVPLDPPFAHPRGLRVCQRIGPHSWRGSKSLLLAPYLVLWEDTPHSPPPWGSAPWTPIFPTPVSFGFASGLGPTRGGVAKVGNSPPLLVFGGTSPKPPARGASSPWTPRLPTLVG